MDLAPATSREKKDLFQEIAREIRNYFKKIISKKFFVSNNLGLPLAITVFGGAEGYSILAIIAFGAFQVIVPKYDCRLAKMEFKESRLLI